MCSTASRICAATQADRVHQLIPGDRPWNGWRGNKAGQPTFLEWELGFLQNWLSSEVRRRSSDVDASKGALGRLRLRSRYLCELSPDVDEQALIPRKVVAGQCVFGVPSSVAGGRQLSPVQRTGIHSPTCIFRLTAAGHTHTFYNPGPLRIVVN
jgi:hypothetical protein